MHPLIAEQHHQANDKTGDSCGCQGLQVQLPLVHGCGQRELPSLLLRVLNHTHIGTEVVGDERSLVEIAELI